MSKLIKVVLWGREDVIGQGVEFLLKSQSECQVFRVIQEDNPAKLFTELCKVQPDVVLLYEGNKCTNPALALQILREFPGVRVIRLSLEDYTVEIFDRSQQMVDKLEDFLDIINFHPKPAGAITNHMFEPAQGVNQNHEIPSQSKKHTNNATESFPRFPSQELP